ncbi:MAG TPA: response regulator [Puia sp.]|jgi:CheY-like chemotaxis protein|nr:response regulator [Puia sp.]
MINTKKIDGLERVLLVDDDRPTNFLHSKVIKNSNFDTHVQVTTSGAEALEYLTCTGRYVTGVKYPQPGIIFLDINMPGMSGWDFLEDYEKLNENQKARIIVVMLTTSDKPVEKASAFTGIKCFINKPLKVDVLKNLVHKYFVTPSV